MERACRRIRDGSARLYCTIPVQSRSREEQKEADLESRVDPRHQVDQTSLSGTAGTRRRRCISTSWGYLSGNLHDSFGTVPPPPVGTEGWIRRA